MSKFKVGDKIEVRKDMFDGGCAKFNGCCGIVDECNTLVCKVHLTLGNGTVELCYFEPHQLKRFVKPKKSNKVLANVG